MKQFIDKSTHSGNPQDEYNKIQSGYPPKGYKDWSQKERLFMKFILIRSLKNGESKISPMWPCPQKTNFKMSEKQNKTKQNNNHNNNKTKQKHYL